MDQGLVQELLQKREGQSLEFKTSLAELDDGTQTAVAFANAQGGHVLFGVKDDGTVVGVDVGANTLENTANSLSAHTYPSLPMVVEANEISGKTVIAVEIPKDVPPVVGVYMYSSNPIEPTKSVNALNLRAFRRVGRTDQQVDFMALRLAMPSDPHVVLRLGSGGEARGQHFPRSRYFQFSNGGSGWAHDVSFETEHPFYSGTVSISGVSLPPPDQDSTQLLEKPRSAKLAITNADEESDLADVPLRLHAVYSDSHGLVWRSTLDMLRHASSETSGVYSFKAGRFGFRLIEFPPKAELFGVRE